MKPRDLPSDRFDFPSQDCAQDRTSWSRDTNHHPRHQPHGEAAEGNRAPEHALTPEAIEDVILQSEREDQRDQRTALENEAADVDRRMGRLLDMLETGSPVALVGRIKEPDSHLPPPMRNSKRSLVPQRRTE